MSKLAIRYDRNLTNSAKSIFGGIVDKAYISTYDIDSIHDDIMSRLNEIMSVSSNERQIDYGSETICIKFTSGAIVEFKNSECAFISSIDETDLREVEES